MPISPMAANIFCMFICRARCVNMNSDFCINYACFTTADASKDFFSTPVL